MKVGILSMHRVINYGSFLQAYALKQLLLDNGANEVTFIDIKPGIALDGFKKKTIKTCFQWWVQRIKETLCGRLSYRLRHHKYREKVKECIQNHFYQLEIDKNEGFAYDLVVIGSDEVFNCCQKTGWGYTLQLYGDVPEAKRVVSYAGSFGHTQYEQLLEHGIDKDIAKTLKTMSAISVRDYNSFDIVKRLTGIDSYIHLDPVLIYGYQTMIEQAQLPEDKDYIIVYAYAERVTNKSEIKAICDFAKKYNKKLYSFIYYEWCDKTIIPSSPFDVLKWFKGSDYVITDTFHGTIFSIITQHQFVTLIRPSNKNKIGCLLDMLGLSERGVFESNEISDVLDTLIDYQTVNDILNENRIKANKYLQMILN